MGDDQALRVYPVFDAGADGYPEAWHTTVKHAVREAAGHRCERCGHPYPPRIVEAHPRGEWTPCDERCTHEGEVRVLVPYEDEPDTPPEWWETTALRPVGELIERSHGQVHEARWRILTVHHLRQGQEAKCDLRWWNLAALCQRCHLEIQSKVRMETPWPWPHSGWFRLHAAGFYAWHHLGLDLTREETEARADELLKIGAERAAEVRMPL